MFIAVIEATSTSSPKLMKNDKKSPPEDSVSTTCIEPFNAVTPSEDNYSSEEELKEIINEQKLKGNYWFYANKTSIEKSLFTISTDFLEIWFPGKSNSMVHMSSAEGHSHSMVVCDPLWGFISFIDRN